MVTQRDNHAFLFLHRMSTVTSHSKRPWEEVLPKGEGINVSNLAGQPLFTYKTGEEMTIGGKGESLTQRKRRRLPCACMARETGTPHRRGTPAGRDGRTPAANDAPTGRV